jgi:transposase-like protein
MKPPPDPHYRHRFPAEIIRHAVWLYHVFCLSLRHVELLLAERGVVVSYETVRRWYKKFGASFADRLRRRRPRPGDKWHMVEVFIRIRGVQHYLWRAVDQDGVVLDILVQARHDANAAKRFFKQLLRGLQYVPRVIVTDKVRSYGVAQRQLLLGVEHRQSRYLNNRGRELASTDATTRAADATVQIDRTSPGLPLRSLLHPQSLPSSSTPTSCPCLSCDSVRRFQTLAPGDLRPTRSMIGTIGLPSAAYYPREGNVTMPVIWLSSAREIRTGPAPQARLRC